MSTASFIIACCQSLTNTFVSKALKRENVQLITVLDSLDIIYAIILQYIFFGKQNLRYFTLEHRLLSHRH